MTHITAGTEKENAKWRDQANRIAQALKKTSMPEPEIKIGIAFDDAIVRLTLQRADVQRLSVKDLADRIYQQTMLAAQAPKGTA